VWHHSDIRTLADILWPGVVLHGVNNETALFVPVLVALAGS
jgi:hypothetical protein